jgi:exonuclease III
MMMENILIWSVRGLNARIKRDMVRGVVAQECISLLMLQETKLDSCDDVVVANLCGAGFDFLDLPASHTSDGILLAWHRDVWAANNVIARQVSLTARIALLDNGEG